MEDIEQSPEMSRLFVNPTTTQKKHFYPFETLELGRSFTVPNTEVNINVIRVIASRAGKKLGRRFKVINHKDLSLYEVGRLPDPEPANES